MPALDPELVLQAALDLAFRQLERRDRTVLEMRRHLEGKRVEPGMLEQALTRLGEQGYLDDARFARQFAEDRRLLDEWGADRIARRLTALGVPAEIVRATVGARDRMGELEAALALLRRRFPALGDDPRERQRAYGVLARKGYDAELAWDALRAHLAARHRARRRPRRFTCESTPHRPPASPAVPRPCLARAGIHQAHSSAIAPQQSRYYDPGSERLARKGMKRQQIIDSSERLALRDPRPPPPLGSRSRTDLTPRRLSPARLSDAPRRTPASSSCTRTARPPLPRTEHDPHGRDGRAEEEERPWRS